MLFQTIIIQGLVLLLISIGEHFPHLHGVLPHPMPVYLDTAQMKGEFHPV